MAENLVVLFENVSKIYQVVEVSIPALTGISLQIPRGRFSMVLGPSGSGKTTYILLSIRYPASKDFLQTCNFL